MHTVGSRVLVLPVTALATLLTARLLTGQYGETSYAIFALLASIPALLPFTDLGLAAQVTNAAAGLPTRNSLYLAVRRKTYRVLSASSFFVCATALALGSLGLWPRMLGLPETTSTNLGISIAIVLFGLSIPLSSGIRALLGMKHGALAVLLQATGPVASLLSVAGAVAFSAPQWVVLGSSTIGGLIVGTIATLMAARRHAQMGLARNERHDAPFSFWGIAAASMVLTVTLPLTFQSHRLLISWSAEVEMLAVYSATAMVFFPVLSVLQAAGSSLWGDFASTRSDAKASHALKKRATWLLVGLSVFGVGILLSIGPPLSRWATSGLIELSFDLYLAFGGVLLVQGFHMASGMFLTDEQGLRFQSMTSSLMAIGAIGGGLVLVPLIGVVGPVWSTAVSLLVFHAIPCNLAASERIRRMRSAP